MLFNLNHHIRLVLGLIWTSAFMLMLAHLLYGEVSLRESAPNLLQDFVSSMSMPALRPVPI